MRLQLTIRPCTKGANVPLSYSYYLSAAIYHWIEQSSPEYSQFLHEQGFSPQGIVRRFKHFCFSQLVVPRRTIAKGRLWIESSTIEWFVGMPVEESLQHLIVGMFEEREFYIESEVNKFVVEQVQSLAEPRWDRTMSFRMLSPLTVSIPEERSGKLQPHYLRADDSRLTNALRTNILNKYASLFGSEPDDKEFHCTLDEKFITQRGGPDRISKLITVKQGRHDETKVRGFMCPLTVEGNPQLIKLAYESGLGEKGSLGFGMIKVIPE